MRHTQNYAIIWRDGKYSVGEDHVIAKSYCKRKRLTLGLLRLNGSSRVVYSFKVNGRWKPQGTIIDTNDYDNNRRAAFKDFFRHLLNNQDEFSIVRLQVSR